MGQVCYTDCVVSYTIQAKNYKSCLHLVRWVSCAPTNNLFVGIRHYRASPIVCMASISFFLINDHLFNFEGKLSVKVLCTRRNSTKTVEKPWFRMYIVCIFYTALGATSGSGTPDLPSPRSSSTLCKALHLLKFIAMQTLSPGKHPLTHDDTSILYALMLILGMSSEFS